MKDVSVHDIVQIPWDSENEAFAGSLVIVTEVRTWGVIGDVVVPVAGGSGTAPIRLAWSDFDLTGGKAHWRT